MAAALLLAILPTLYQLRPTDRTVDRPAELLRGAGPLLVHGGTKIAQQSRIPAPAVSSPGHESGTLTFPDNNPASTLPPSPEELRIVWRELWAVFPDLPHEPLKQIDTIAQYFWPLASTWGAALDALRRSWPSEVPLRPADRQARRGFADHGLLLA